METPSPGSPEALSTEELARRARTGSRESFDELIRRHAGPLADFLYQCSGGGSEIEDLVQESFLAAWRNIARYDERRPFRAWLFTLARRRTISQWRRRRLRTVDEERLDSRARGPDPAEVADRRELRDNLWGLVREVLAPEARAALWLSYAEGADNGEIARVLGRSRSTVRVILFRARRRLERHLRARAEPTRRVEDPPSAVLLGGEP